MQQLDTDLQYMEHKPRPTTPGSRLNTLLALPILGFVLLLVLVGAAIFQLDFSDLIDTLMGLFMLVFLVTIVLLFWALAPRAHTS